MVLHEEHEESKLAKFKAVKTKLFIQPCCLHIQDLNNTFLDEIPDVCQQPEVIFFG